jgi:hypothetical protein
MALSRLLIGPIDTAEDAQTSLQFVALGCYAFAGLALVCGLSKIGHGSVTLATALQTPLLFGLSGIFLPRHASRTLACFIAPLSLTFALMSCDLAINSPMNVYLAIDLVFSVVLIWVTVRSLQATFRYHAIRRSKVNWPNVWRSSGRAFAGIFIGVLVVNELISSQLIGVAFGKAAILGILVVVPIECFVIATRKRPWVSYAEPMQVPQEHEVSDRLGDHVVLAVLLPRMGQVRRAVKIPSHEH